MEMFYVPPLPQNRGTFQDVRDAEVIVFDEDDGSPIFQVLLEEFA